MHCFAPVRSVPTIVGWGGHGGGPRRKSRSVTAVLEAMEEVSAAASSSRQVPCPEGHGSPKADERT